MRDFLKKFDGLIARNKKLGSDHCAKCDSMNITGIRVSTVTPMGKQQRRSLRKDNNHYASVSQEKMKEHFS